MTLEGTMTLPVLRHQADVEWDVEIGAASNRGGYHEKNQDYYALGESGLSYAMFDGMGGPPFGEIASRVGANAAVDAYESGKTLREAMDVARGAVIMVGKWLHAEDMGCTALMAVIEGSMMQIAWLGDTIAILVRDEKARVLTEPDRARGGGSAITGCFGGGVEREVHECSIHLEEGDVVVLCTDGMWSQADGSVIAAVTTQGSQAAPEIAYDLVFEVARNSADDSSAIVLRFDKALEVNSSV